MSLSKLTAQIWLLALILGLNFASFKASAAGPMEPLAVSSCRELLGLNVPSFGGELGASQAQRLLELVQLIGPEKAKSLFRTLSQHNLQDFATQIKSGTLTTANKKLLEANAGLEMILLDLAELEGSMPGIFGLSNSDEVVLSVLEMVRRQEVQAKISNADLLKSQGMVFRLRSTITNTLVNLIQQGEVEYHGARFEHTGFWYKVHRFFFPTYKKVRDSLDVAQVFERQLSRIQMVDKLIVTKGLGEATGLGLSQPQFEKLATHVLDSPKEISDIVKELKSIFGEDFDIGKSTGIGSFDINKVARSARGKDTDEIVDGFQASVLEELAGYNEVLNENRVKKGQEERTTKDFDLVELQLYHEIYNRRIVTLYRKYDAWISEGVNDSYTVERRHTRQVPDGYTTDSKGNKTPKYRTEVYYLSDTVTPSYKDLLTNSFDTGDRSVSGLDGVKRRASHMVHVENSYRSELSEAEAVIEEIMQSYTSLLADDGSRKENLEKLNAVIEELPVVIRSALKYSKLSKREILDQYSADSHDNFRARNLLMAQRLENIHADAIILMELLDRKATQLFPAFHHTDFTDWLRFLKSKRNQNYAAKTTMGLTASGSVGSYLYFPEAQITVNNFVEQSIQWITQLF